MRKKNWVRFWLWWCYPTPSEGWGREGILRRPNRRGHTHFRRLGGGRMTELHGKLPRHFDPPLGRGAGQHHDGAARRWCRSSIIGCGDLFRKLL